MGHYFTRKKNGEYIKRKASSKSKNDKKKLTPTSLKKVKMIQKNC